jgi:hypothetical protein
MEAVQLASFLTVWRQLLPRLKQRLDLAPRADL